MVNKKNRGLLQNKEGHDKNIISSDGLACIGLRDRGYVFL